MEGLAFFLAILGIASAILWLVIGWRAMRAHERIADSMEHWSRKNSGGGDDARRPERPRPPRDSF